MDDTFRKSPVREINPAKIQNDYCCAAEERMPRRYDTTSKSLCHRQGDTTSDHDLYKLPEEKTSDEGSVTEIETNDSGHGDIRAACHQCDQETKKYPGSSRNYGSCSCDKCGPSRRLLKSENMVEEDMDNTEPTGLCQSSIPSNRNQRNFRNYGNPVNVPQALIALKKLERLKDLQQRREHAEKFYSQEIRRLIGENFFAANTAIVTAPAKNRERIGTPATRPASDETQPIVDQRNRGGGYSKELEPYGTMTTTTRFNCGCSEETTIPIFSSGVVGHVKKCESHRNQERPVSKSAPTYPQEFYRTGENSGKLENLVNPCLPPSRTRGKNPNDCGPYRNLAVNGSRDLESWGDRKTPTRNRRSPRNLSPVKTTSPTRKCSESSIN